MRRSLGLSGGASTGRRLLRAFASAPRHRATSSVRFEPSTRGRTVCSFHGLVLRLRRSTRSPSSFVPPRDGDHLRERRRPAPASPRSRAGSRLRKEKSAPDARGKSLSPTAWALRVRVVGELREPRFSEKSVLTRARHIKIELRGRCTFQPTDRETVPRLVEVHSCCARGSPCVSERKRSSYRHPHRKRPPARRLVDERAHVRSEASR